MNLRYYHRFRRGFTVLEVTIACGMFVACAVVVAQLLHLTARQERVIDGRQAALRGVANHLETLQARTWDELAVREPTDETLPEEVRTLLKSATMHSEVVAVENGSARQIRVWMEWRDPAGNRVQPIELSAWKHQPASRAADQP